VRRYAHDPAARSSAPSELRDDTDAIKHFAGDDFRMAKYCDFNSDYHIEKEGVLRHYEVSSQASPTP
jgi:hypothetical protein